MPKSRYQQTHEPDVTPLINVNLVILVMTLLIASHAARLLPLSLPKAANTDFSEAGSALPLVVAADGSYGFDGQAGLTRDQLAQAIDQRFPELSPRPRAKRREVTSGGPDAPDRQTILVSMAPEARYEALAWALDCIMARESLKVAFGSPGN